jgi:8-hydroxy-5-deazaflavin:NADPH oxidoreductase
VRVAVLGGTGPFGRGLATRLVAADVDVVIGSRDEQRALSAAQEIGCRGARNEDAVAGADIVVLAVVADAVLATAQALGNLLRSPVLSVASELEFAGGTARPRPDTRSLAERTSQVVDVPVVAGLHSLAAGKLAYEKPDEDALVCGNDREAKALALELAQLVVAGRAIDVGPLSVARALEGMTAAILNVNRRYKTHAGLRLTGIA